MDKRIAIRHTCLVIEKKKKKREKEREAELFYIGTLVNRSLLMRVHRRTNYRDQVHVCVERKKSL